MLKRKIDDFLLKWKNNSNKLPLIVNGARQIGKTTSIREFSKNYESFIEINFLLNPEYRDIFKNGYSVDNIITSLSFLNNNFKFIKKNTLLFFDEIQSFPDCMTYLKSFAEDKNYDVICSGSLLGVNYKSITSIPVGFKEEYQMYSLDFEEFLWALGYSSNHIEILFDNMKKLSPIADAVHKKMQNLYRDYIFIGGMPRVVDIFAQDKLFTKQIIDLQREIYLDYEDDIGKYCVGLDVIRVKRFYNQIKNQLSKDNHKFQITKIGHGSRQRDFEGVEEWLYEAGIINIAYNLNNLAVPFSGRENFDYYRVYFAEHSLFIASLDEEDKNEIIKDNNYEIFNGALYESMISEALIKQGYQLYFYKTQDATIELDFLIRYRKNIIPIEVKRNRGRSKSLNAVILNKNNPIKYGIKLTDGNIGFEDNKFTFPSYLSFLLKRFFEETDYIK